MTEVIPSQAIAANLGDRMTNTIRQLSINSPIRIGGKFSDALRRRAIVFQRGDLNAIVTILVPPDYLKESRKQLPFCIRKVMRGRAIDMLHACGVHKTDSGTIDASKKIVLQRLDRKRRGVY
jgi:hypothetical protein